MADTKKVHMDVPEEIIDLIRVQPEFVDKPGKKGAGIGGYINDLLVAYFKHLGYLPADYNERRMC